MTLKQFKENPNIINNSNRVHLPTVLQYKPLEQKTSESNSKSSANVGVSSAIFRLEDGDNDWLTDVKSPFFVEPLGGRGKKGWKGEERNRKENGG